MKTIIVYQSYHHGNTQKLVEAIKEKYDTVEIVSVEQAGGVDLGQYDCIGFAAGIAYGHFYRKVRKFAEKALPKGKKVFLLYTCGKETGKYAKSMEEIVGEKGCELLGTYGCLGLYTFLFYKAAKGRPNEEEIKGAVEFYENICE